MDKVTAVELLHQHIKNPKMIQHCLASGAVLRSLASRLGRNENDWELAGLLHDIDVEITNADPFTHGLVGAKMLEELGLSPDVADAVRMHNEMATGIERHSEFQHALAAGETITGLITAVALVYPDKKVSSVKVKSVTKRMKEKAFAASVKRENILECEKIGLNLDEFCEIAIKAMTEIAEDLEL